MSRTRQIAMPFWVFALAVVLGGCANQYPNDLPGDAKMTVEGNQRIAWTAPSRGTVFIYDDNNQHLLYSGEVHRGDLVSVDPDNDWIKIGDRKVTEKSLARGRNHRIFFAPAHDSMRDQDRMSSTDADVRTDSGR